jgi:hypothetical protein
MHLKKVIPKKRAKLGLFLYQLFRFKVKKIC